MALTDYLPPRFQDELTSRYAYGVYVLRPSTPLALQADHMRSLAGFCVATLCFWLFCVFSFEQVWAPWLPSVLVLVITAFAVKSWKIYTANCHRAMLLAMRKFDLKGHTAEAQ